jgi:hypothetical protein
MKFQEEEKQAQVQENCAPEKKPFVSQFLPSFQPDSGSAFRLFCRADWLI